MKFVGALVVVAAAVCSLAAAQSSYLPQVDLGYEIHQAIDFNSTGQYYNFSNIRYAQPPVGQLRFARPVPPAGRNPDVQNGNKSVMCPQASPVWQLIGLQFATAFSNGSLSSWNYTLAKNIALAQLAAIQSSNVSNSSVQATEDCLFLDVFSPKSAFDLRNSTGNRGAPVLVWIYGGGYTLGSKTGSGNPAGLIAASMRNATGNSSEPIIFVAMNYRLGALGWLSGPTFQSEGGISNAGLYDQRLAIQWVRQNIRLFGGDPSRITLMGESAGGGSIMYQMAAYGGTKGVNFQQAIIQSPGWFPISSEYVQDNTTQNYFNLLNVSSVAEARALNSSAVIRANTLQVAASQYGMYTYGPVYDGVFSVAQPGLSLLNGQYAQNINVMVGHNTNEGVFFAPSYVMTDADVYTWLRSEYPNSPTQVTDYITQVLYPPVYDGSQNYTTPVERCIRIVTEQIFTCNTDYLARAQDNMTYNYQFEVPPALHGNDVPYTFYNGPASGIVQPVANALQGYITQFAATGNPNAPGLPYFPMQGYNASQVGLNTSSIAVQVDPTVNSRCVWWQKYLYT